MPQLQSSPWGCWVALLGLHRGSAASSRWYCFSRSPGRVWVSVNFLPAEQCLRACSWDPGRGPPLPRALWSPPRRASGGGGRTVARAGALHAAVGPLRSRPALSASPEPRRCAREAEGSPRESVASRVLGPVASLGNTEEAESSLTCRRLGRFADPEPLAWQGRAAVDLTSGRRGRFMKICTQSVHVHTCVWGALEAFILRH